MTLGFWASMIAPIFGVPTRRMIVYRGLYLAMGTACGSKFHICSILLVVGVSGRMRQQKKGLRVLDCDLVCVVCGLRIAVCRLEIKVWAWNKYKTGPLSISNCPTFGKLAAARFASSMT